jgi:hypothetical protein
MVVGAIISVGILLRLRQYATNRSLWLDEAMLALNIVNRSFAQLLQPLDYNQGAPVAFLFIQKALVLIFGNHEAVLRLFPLVTGITSLILFSRVADRYLTGARQWVTLSLFAFSDPLIYYTSEAKQYSSDVMVTLLLMWAASRWRDNTLKLGTLALLAMVGAVSIWLSHPAVFVLTALASGFALVGLIQKDWRTLARLIGPVSIWLVSFTTLYNLSLRALGSNPELISYWSGQFMPMPPWRDPTWLSNAYMSLLSFSLLGRLNSGSAAIPPEWLAIYLSAIAVLIGAITYLARRWQKGIDVILPLVFTLAASGWQKYPFEGRLLLFSVPLVLLLAGEGLEQLEQAVKKVSSKIGPYIGLALGIFILFAPAALAVQHCLWPWLVEDIKPVLAYIAQHQQPSDKLVVYYGAEPAFRYYAAEFGLSNRTAIASQNESQGTARYLQDLDKLTGQGRIWILFTHPYGCDNCGVFHDEEAYWLDHLNGLGKRIDRFAAAGAAAYLYDFVGLAP